MPALMLIFPRYWTSNSAWWPALSTHDFFQMIVFIFMIIISLVLMVPLGIGIGHQRQYRMTIKYITFKECMCLEVDTRRECAHDILENVVWSSYAMDFLPQILNAMQCPHST